MKRLFTKWFRKDKRNTQTRARPVSREELQTAGLDIETLAWTKSFVDRYGAALRELANAE